MADILPITTYVDITVEDSVATTFADPKKGLIVTTGDFDPDYVTSYSGDTAVDDIGDDFGTDSNIYKAASFYFGQSVQPDELLVGVHSESIPAICYGGTPNSIEDIIEITNGAMSITTASGTYSLTGLDFSSAESLTDVLSLIKAALLAAGYSDEIIARYGSYGFVLYGATAFPADIATVAATAGYLTGGEPEDLATFQAISDGGFTISIDGTSYDITGVILSDTAAVLTGGSDPADPSTLTASDYHVAITIGGTLYETGDIDLSAGVTTTAEVVSAIQTAFNTAGIPGTVSYDSDNTAYVITSTATGDVSITVTSTPGSGTDLGTLLSLDDGTAVSGEAEVTTLAEVATKVTAAITTAGGSATCTYDSDNEVFIITSGSTGSSSSIGYGSDPASGEDLSASMSLRSSLGATVTAGVDSYSPDATVELLGLVSTATNASLSDAETGVLIQESLANIYSANNGWMMLSVTKELRDSNSKIASWISSYNDRIFIATDQTTNPEDPSESGVILNFYNKGYENATAIYHSQAYENEYIDAAASGWLAGLDFEVSNGYKQIAFKTMVGITADTIGDPDGFMDLYGNYHVNAGYANETVKKILYPGMMANGLLISEKIADISMQYDLKNAVFNVLANTGNVPLSSRGTALVKTALENAIESKWKINGFVPSDGGEYEDSAGNVISLPKGYTFNVYTTATSRAEHRFIVEGTVLKEGSVLKVEGTVTVQQAS